ncbi:MAG: hypothetical protein K6G56_05210 [Clostridiales bacterium]|nr:hypothetical protein [Clostridiales bacterium]
MLNILSFLYAALFALSGVMAARLLFPKDRLVKQLLFGLTLGLVMLLWLPVLPSFIFGFTLASQVIALVIAVGVGVLCAVFGKDRAVTGSFKWKTERPLLLTCVPLVLIGVILMCNHYITNASDGSLHVGQCTYGDLCMHLGFITSISVQKTFPPMYSILPDTALGYPFLCDSVSSTFYTLGSTLRFATILPAVYAHIVTVLGVYLLFEDWFKRDSAAVLGTWLFFVGGGFGFAYFFDNAKTFAGLDSGNAWSNWLKETMNIYATVPDGSPLDMGKLLMEGWYKTPTNFVDNGLRWVNSIADMIIPQRATLFGWALLFPALQLLRRAVFEKETRFFIYLGVLAGAMPLVHTHSFFALGLMSAFLLVALLIGQASKKLTKDERKEGRRRLLYFLLFGAIAVALAAPQLFGFTFRQSSAGGFIKYHFNWCNESDSWLWFYIKNLGFIFLLMVPAFLCAKKETKLFYGGTLLIWALCEFVVFQPNTYDNNKLLFVWFALTCGIVADFLIGIWDRLHALPVNAGKKEKQAKLPLGRRIAYALTFAALIFSMLLSGVMTLAREYVSGDHLGFEEHKLKYKENGYQVVSADLVGLTDWMRDNVEPDATVLTATNHNNAVAMLTGRNIVCGAPTFLFYHGVNYGERYNDVRRMYEDPSGCFRELAEKYGVDYVLISGWERSSYSVDAAFFSTLTPVYREGGTVLYKVD